MSDDPQAQAANPPEDESATESSSPKETSPEIPVEPTVSQTDPTAPNADLAAIDESRIEPEVGLAAIERAAIDARVRRAPRYGRFIFVGSLIGAVAGVLAALIVRIVTDQSVNFGAVTIFSALGLATLGALICGIIAVMQDRRSVAGDDLPESHADMGE